MYLVARCQCKRVVAFAKISDNESANEAFRELYSHYDISESFEIPSDRFDSCECHQPYQTSYRKIVGAFVGDRWMQDLSEIV